jgi:hypothetical protein
MFKSFKTAAVVVGMTLAGAVLACSINGTGGFLPENDLYIPANLKGLKTGITEAQFNAAIDSVEVLYAPIVTSLGGNLMIERKWSDGTVNAYAQQSGKSWKVAMFGGLARHKTITQDGMALVVCHELGHHIGGAPKKAGSIFGGAANAWASNEGQADYFATLKCLRKTFLNDDNIAIVAAMTVPATLSDACKKSTKNDKEDTALCVRTSMAGKSVANLFSELSKLPEAKFDSPDSKVVSKTDDAHPKAQCRLDTYFQGSLCEIGMNEDVSQKEEVKGTCHPTLGHKIGTRPLCWFKPKAK